jgi:hypothetical protein
MALTFLSFRAFYFVLFPLGSQNSNVVHSRAVSSLSDEFLFIFSRLSFYKLITLRRGGLSGEEEKKAGAKKEYRMKNSVTSLPLLHSLYFVPGLFFFFLFLSPLCLSVCLPLFIFCFVERVYLFIYLAHSQQLDTLLVLLLLLELFSMTCNYFQSSSPITFFFDCCCCSIRMKWIVIY